MWIKRKRGDRLDQMKRHLAVALAFLFLLVGPASALGAGPFQRLDGREFQGTSIVGPNGEHPVQHPADLRLHFGTAALTGVATPTLYWTAGCRGHSYLLSFVHRRLHTYVQVSSKSHCIGQQRREERWLENFFAADLGWSLRHGRLTLISGQRQIALIGKWLLGNSR
jgi:hypothetical protein